MNQKDFLIQDTDVIKPTHDSSAALPDQLRQLDDDDDA